MDINIIQAKETILDILKAGLVPNLIGSPGLGKSDLIREIAKDQNLEVIDFRLAQADPTDLCGFPTLNKERTRSTYAPPITFPLERDNLPENKNGWLLFFDEMPAAPMSVQAASYKIVLDRMVGQEHLHKNVAIVCAGNKMTDKAIVNRLSTAMQSRLIHLNLEVNLDSWVKWALSNNVDNRIISFLQFKPDLLHNFDPSHKDLTFPCPRTWTFLSALVKNKNKINFESLPVMAGTVGEGAAREFKGFIEIYESLPTIQTLLTHPDTVNISEEPSTLYAITALISENANAKTIPQLIKVIERLPPEFQVITLQNIIKKDNTMLKIPEIKIWISANALELL